MSEKKIINKKSNIINNYYILFFMVWTMKETKVLFLVHSIFYYYSFYSNYFKD